MYEVKQLNDSEEDGEKGEWTVGGVCFLYRKKKIIKGLFIWLESAYF